MKGARWPANRRIFEMRVVGQLRVASGYGGCESDLRSEQKETKKTKGAR